jgi:hypothetical protein
MPVIQVQDEFQSGDNVTASSLNDLVNDASFVSGAVDNSTLQVASAGHLKVKDNGILSNHLKSDATNDAVRAVTTNHIRNDAVTNAKIANLAVDTDQIAADAVTYAKIQNVSETDRVLGRDSAGAGNVEEITPSALRTMINVEDGATADQTASEIKTAYESNNDTNVFTDAEKNKLTGIAAGAEVNIQSDWNATTGDALILNKPTITSGTVTEIVAGTGLSGGTITSSGTIALDTGGIDTDQLADGSVTSAKISSTDSVFKINSSNQIRIGGDLSNSGLQAASQFGITSSTASILTVESTGTTNATDDATMVIMAPGNSTLQLNDTSESSGDKGVYNIESINGTFNIGSLQAGGSGGNLDCITFERKSLAGTDYIIPRFENLPIFDSNSAATSGGLSLNDVYKTSTGELRIVI